MQPKYQHLLFSILSTSLLLQGCAGFKANQLPTVATNELQTTNTVRTKAFTSWQVVPAMPSDKQKKQFNEALLSTNCCVLVDNLNDAELVVKGVSYEDDSSLSLVFAFITGYSLFTIPSWHTSNVKLTANVQRGDKRANVEAADSMTTVAWLPMLFALPFANPIDNEKYVTDNTYKALVLKIKNEGLLQ